MRQFLSRFLTQIRAGWLHWLLLILLLAASLAIRAFRIGEPIGGFQAPTEATNLLLAQQLRSGSLLLPSLDGETAHLASPPLYPTLIHWLSWVPLPDWVTARVISLLAGVGSVGLVYAIGRLLFSPAAGLMAAALFAFTPMGVLLGHDALSDSLFLFLLLLAHWSTLRSMAPAGHSPQPVFSGLAFAAACLTRLFALASVIPLLLSETLRHGGWRWVREQRLYTSAAIAAAVAAPFFMYHATRDFPHFLEDTFAGDLQLLMPWAEGRVGLLAAETWWGLSPALCILFLLGLVGGLIWIRDWRFRYLLLQGTTFLVLFLFAHKYSYFVWPVSPFLALLAGATLARMRFSGLAAGITALGALTGIMFTLVLMCQVKYGRDEFSQIQKFQRGPCADCVVLVEDNFVAGLGPMLHYYFGRDRVLNLSQIPRTAEGELEIESLGDRILLFHLAEGKTSNVDVEVRRTLFSPIFFGHEVREDHPSIHHFRMGSFSFQRNPIRDTWYTFTVRPVERKPTIGLLFISRQLRILLGEQGLYFREKN